MKDSVFLSSLSQIFRQKTSLVRFIGLAFIFLLFSCGFDNSGAKPSYTKVEKLSPGQYNVTSAFRNGKSTSSLNGAYYIIQDDRIKTNLSQTLDSIETKYKYKDNKISHSDSNALNFDVVNQSSDSLRLLTELRGFTFEIILLRADTLNEN